MPLAHPHISWGHAPDASAAVQHAHAMIVITEQTHGDEIVGLRPWIALPDTGEELSAQFEPGS